MKIAVIGAGIVGVTTAYELAADGHQVSVFERRSAVAEETSFANAGVVAPGYVTPWAAPGMPSKVLSSLFSSHAPVRVRVPLSANDMAWMWRWYRACNLPTYMTNRARMQRLAYYSRTRLHTLSKDLHLDYERAEGYMVLLRSEKEHLLVQPSLQVLRDAKTSFKELTAEEARKLEPALNPDTPLHASIHLPQDEVGNCRQFAMLLKSEAQRLGTNFVFNTPIVAIDKATPATLWVANEDRSRSFDAVVLCAGLDSAGLMKNLGVKIPMTAVYGYSISAAVREPLNSPRSALMDERYKVAISRIGQRIRVAGSAEIGGSLNIHRESAIQTLYKVLGDWFPGAAQLASHRRGNAVGTGVQEWKGARPMLPDGPPIICSSGLPGLWLNLGHGSSGWALSCGCARAVTDLIAGRKPDVDLDGLGMERLKH